MKKIPTKFDNCFLIKTKIIKDKRGYFSENFRKNIFDKFTRKKYVFVQENISMSSLGVLRGLHYQKKKAQGKLISVVKGKIFDVIVDLRKNSKTFLQWQAFILSDKENLQLWVDPGFAHGFVSLSNNTIINYKCTNYYSKKNEKILLWNDKTININWPKNIKFLISKKDLNGAELSKEKFR